jgi:erythromycin esterase
MKQILISLLFFISVVINIYGQNGNTIAQNDSIKSVIQWVKSNAIPISTVEPDNDNSDLQPLKSIIGTRRLVAYGEPTHGAHEPLAFRNRLFKYLVEEMDFNGIAIETGLSSSRLANDFVLGKPVNIDLALKAFTYTFGTFDENKNLLLWMKDYNMDTTHQEKIHFYGMDMSQRDGFTSLSIEKALNYIQQVDAKSFSKLQANFQPYLNHISSTKKEKKIFTSDEYNQFTTTIEDLIALLQRRRPEFIKLTSEVDFSWALQIAINLRQSDRTNRLAPIESAVHGKAPSDIGPFVNSRDVSMAENVKWALKRSGIGGKLMVFAHNGHVMKSKMKGGLYENVVQPPNALGMYLKSYFGNELFVIGTSSAHNGEGLPTANYKSGSLDHVLSQTEYKQYLLNLKTASTEPAILRWFSGARISRMNFTSYLNIVPMQAFDMILFIDKLTKTGKW